MSKMQIPLSESPASLVLSDFLRGLWWFCGIVAAILLCLGVLGSMIGGIFVAILFLLIMSAPVWGIVFIAICLFHVGRGVKVSRTEGMSRFERTASATAAPSAILLLVLMSLPAIWIGSHVGSSLRFIANRPFYGAVIAHAQEHGELREGVHLRYAGMSYIIDRGPPLRIAFHPEGILDNWTGIIFDPSGEVMLADGWDANGRWRAPERITKLFGGDLVACSRLWGSYYRCSFT